MSLDRQQVRGDLPAPHAQLHRGHGRHLHRQGPQEHGGQHHRGAQLRPQPHHCTAAARGHDREQRDCEREGDESVQVRHRDGHVRGTGQEAHPDDDGAGRDGSVRQHPQVQDRAQNHPHHHEARQVGGDGVLQGHVPFHAEQQQVRPGGHQEEVRQIEVPPGVEDKAFD